jgi:hypothetical protein
MAVLELTKEQVFDLVRQMPAKDKREILQVLAEDSGGPATSGLSEFEQRFATLAAEWKAERGHSSPISKLCTHQAYQQIVGMGEKAVPLLLRELEREPDHWFWALKAITGVNPVPQESRANIREMARHWVKWGHEQGYRR